MKCGKICFECDRKKEEKKKGIRTLTAVNDALFDILESESDDKYYLLIDSKRWAEEPAFIICSGPFAKLGVHSWTVYMGRGLVDWTVKTHKAAKAKILWVISKSRKPITKVKHVNHKGKTHIISLEKVKK